jgi:ribosome-associated protein
MTRILFDTPYITLAAFLKFSGAAATGGQAKELIATGQVTVNGVPCVQKGKKLYGGEMVSLLGDQTYEVVKRCT